MVVGVARTAATCAVLAGRTATLAAAFACAPAAANCSSTLRHTTCCHLHAREISEDLQQPGFSYGDSQWKGSLLSRLRRESLGCRQALFSSRGGGVRGDWGSSGGGRQGGELGCSTSEAAADVRREEPPAPMALEGVKNIRDLGSIKGSGIVKGRVFRTGYLSAATETDTATLRDVAGLRTLVDLRSATEIGMDKLINSEVYDGFVSVGGTEHCRRAADLQDDELPEEPDILDEKASGRRRYFVSLIDESIYKKGVFQRLRRRHKAAVMALAPAALLSRRVTQKARGIFLRQINAGGLILLNELLLQFSGRDINRVLRLLATRERHPVALYCTAGKDRTGLIIALVLSTLGVPDEVVVDDYAQSASAYEELGNLDAMVGALAQRELDPETFLGAPRHVMEEVLRFVRVKYGSVDGYLDLIGFDTEWRARLRQALLEE